MTAPVAAGMVEMEAAYWLGPSNFTTKVVPGIVTGAGYAIAAAEAVFTANDVYAGGTGKDVLLDTMFDGREDAYEITRGLIYTESDAYIELGCMFGTSQWLADGTDGQEGEMPKKTVNTRYFDDDGVEAPQKGKNAPDVEAVDGIWKANMADADGAPDGLPDETGNGVAAKRRAVSGGGVDSGLEGNKPKEGQAAEKRTEGVYFEKGREGDTDTVTYRRVQGGSGDQLFEH